MDVAFDSSSSAADTSAEPAGTAGATTSGLRAAASSPVSEPAEADSRPVASSSDPVAIAVPAPVTVTTKKTARSKGNELPRIYLPSNPGLPVWSKSDLMLDEEDEEEADVFPLPEPKYLDPEWAKDGVPDTKFYKDYPPDPWRQEAAPNARVWKIYRDEMTTADADTLKSWNGTIDVLLIFAGLFSAVSTAFIVESYKNLQADYTQYIANVLYTTATSNRTANGIVLNLLSIGSMGSPDSYVRPSATQRWTNGLWFTSLVVSLTVALLCIMVKQWLNQYHTRTKRSAPSLQGWARRHQLYHRGLRRWGVPTLISLLPLLLHVSLFLFFAGLVLFLRPLDGTIAFALLAILTLTLLFYVFSLVIPALCIDCPSYQPLLPEVKYLITFGLQLLLVSSALCYYPLRIFGRMFANSALETVGVLEELLSRSKRPFGRETRNIDAQKFVLDGQALNTLLVSTNDPNFIDASVEAIGAISAVPTLKVVVREGPLEVINERTGRNSGITSAFAVITAARRVRTYWTLQAISREIPSQLRIMEDLYPFLGLEGMMIQLMATVVHLRPSADALVPSFRQRVQAHVLDLFHQVESGQVDRLKPSETHTESDSGPHYGSSSLLFLRYMRNWEANDPYYIPFVLLTFCAGDFAEAESHERASAIQSLFALLERVASSAAPSGNAPAGPGDADDVARSALDRLFTLLATLEEILVDQDTAGPFMLHLGLVSWSLSPPMGVRSWAQLAGFAAFTQSSIFAQNISRVGLRAFIDVLKWSGHPRSKDVETLQQYWTCVANLLKLSGDFGLPPVTWFLPGIFLARPKAVIDMFALAPDSLLLKFMQAATALDARADHLASVANGLSCLLCYRLRIRPVSKDLVQPIFNGRFLVNNFRDVMVHARPTNRRLRIMTLAKHCARLNRLLSDSTGTSARPLSAMLRICDELESPSDDGDALPEGALALVGEIRLGLQPGGELLGECDPSCDCWPEAEPTNWPTRWTNRILACISATSHSDSAV